MWHRGVDAFTPYMILGKSSCLLAIQGLDVLQMSWYFCIHVRCSVVLVKQPTLASVFFLSFFLSFFFFFFISVIKQ